VALRAEARRYARAVAGELWGAPDAALLAQARAAAAGGAPDALEALARLEQAASTGTPLAHMLAAAQAQPTAERWLAVARWSEQQPQIFSALTEALALDPASADIRLAFADYYAGRGQTRKALGLLQAVAGREPGDFRLAWRRAELEATLGRGEQANAEFDRLAREFPQPLWMMFRAAQHAEEVGRLNEAEATLRALLAADPRDAIARAQMARVLERRRDTAGLRRLYLESAALDPADLEPRRRLAALDGTEPEVRAKAPAARVDGVLVQRMIAGGTEMILGVKSDPLFGPAVVCGFGGILKMRALTRCLPLEFCPDRNP